MTVLRCPDTIVACCTSQGGTGGALAIIRISGPQALIVADSCVRLSHRKTVQEQASHTLHHGHVIESQGAVIDEILCAIMRAPKTFTGEETVEITCHNNPIILMRVIAACVQGGARLAERGEFTRQALLNKKVDLTQAEAIHDLINATTTQAIGASLAQLSGTMSSEMHSIERQLLAALAWCEASFEFAEEVGSFGERIRQQVITILEHIARLQRAHSASHGSREGFRVALVGDVNAGKSSLFNALIGRERAIVTPFPGTTRDTIEARIVRYDMVWTLIDTAGLRETADIIEQQGIERSLVEAHQADVLLFVVPYDTLLHSESAKYRELLTVCKESSIIVRTKADLMQSGDVPYEEQACEHPPSVLVSSRDRTGIDRLEALIAERIRSLCTAQSAPYFINQRHYTVLVQLAQQLDEVLRLFGQACIPYELVSHHMRVALEKLGEISGTTISADALDKVFQEFCIGK